MGGLNSKSTPEHTSLEDVDALESVEEEDAFARERNLKIRRIIVRVLQPSVGTFGDMHGGYERITEGSYRRTEFHHAECACGGCVVPPAAPKKKRTKKASVASDDDE